jgi:hypothetical protein
VFILVSARRRPNHRRLMADYGGAGVWDHDGAPLDPAKLPLSLKLRARLARWTARFEKSFEDEIDLEAFQHSFADLVTAATPPPPRAAPSPAR